MIDIIKAIGLHERAIKKLVEVTDEHSEMISKLCESNNNRFKHSLAQLMINNDLDVRLKNIEDVSIADRLDLMEDYVDKLTKRVRELETNNSNTNTRNCAQHSNCTHCHK